MTLQRAPQARRVFGRAGTDSPSRTVSGAPSGPPSGALSRPPSGSSSRALAADGAPAATDRFRLGTWPDQLHPELQEFIDYWLSKHGPQGQLPSRAQIDPSEIPTLLTGIALYDVERVNTSFGYRFKYRLLGTRHSAANQGDFSGRYVEDVHYPDEAVPIIGAFSLVVERKLPHYWRRERVSRADTSRRIPYERIVVPLAADGTNVNMLLGHFIFHDAAGDNWHWWRGDGAAG
ncbi:MAG: PAS domain-containing protein [Rhodospirillaceae bacterium]|nr:PAS domain-containing protein [Rhodospirillaceae bacterium]